MIRPKVRAVAQSLTDKNVKLHLDLTSPMHTVSTDANGVVIAPALIESISAIASNSISLIKGSLLPEIKEITKACMDEIKARKLDTPVSSKPISYYTVTPLVELLQERGYIAKDKEFPKATPAILEFKGMSVSDLQDRIGFGSGSLKDLTSTAFSSEEELERIYTTYARYVTNGSPFQSLLMGIATADQFKDLVLTYVLFCSLDANGYVGNVASPTTDPKSAIKNIINRLGQSLVYTLKYLESASKTKVGYITNGNISLFRETADAYLKDGGKIEAIFGASLSYEGFLSIEDVKANQKTFADSWVSFLSIENVKVRTENVAIYKDIYAKHLVKSYTDASDELTRAKYDSAYVEKLAVAYIRDLESVYVYDTATVIRHAYLGILYRHTNAFSFVNYMEAYLSADDTLSPKKAAVLATAEVIADHLLCTVAS